MMQIGPILHWQVIDHSQSYLCGIHRNRTRIMPCEVTCAQLVWGKFIGAATAAAWQIEAFLLADLFPLVDLIITVMKACQMVLSTANTCSNSHLIHARSIDSFSTLLFYQTNEQGRVKIHCVTQLCAGTMRRFMCACLVDRKSSFCIQWIFMTHVDMEHVVENCSLGYG